MKKWMLWAVLVVIIFGTVFFSTRKNRQPEVTADGKIVVTINNGPKETDQVAVQRMKEDIARFNKIYPNIEIRWTDRPYSPDSFTTSMAGGTAEDVISLWATEGYVAERGYALDLTEFINSWEYKDELNVEVLKPFTRDGRIYALPKNGYIMGLWYNKTLFKAAGLDENGQAKPPETWEEFVEVAKKITNKQKGIAGFGIMGNGAEAGWGFLNWVWQAGGDFQVQKDGKWQAVFDSKEAVEALDFIKALRWQHDVLQANLLATGQELQQRFAAGQIGMMLGTQDWIPNLVNQYGMKLEDIGVAMLPRGPGGYANQMGGNYFIINPSSPPEVQEAAFKWITWTILGSMQPERIAEKGEDLRKEGRIGYLSALPIFIGKTDETARESARPYSDVLIDYPEVWREAAKYMRPEPPFFSQQLYSEYLGSALQNVLTNKNADCKQLLVNAVRGFTERFLNQVN